MFGHAGEILWSLSSGDCDWLAKEGVQVSGHRESWLDRGVHYKHTRHALEAVRQNVGFLVCGLSLVLRGLKIDLLLPHSRCHITSQLRFPIS